MTHNQPISPKGDTISHSTDAESACKPTTPAINRDRPAPDQSHGGFERDTDRSRRFCWCSPDELEIVDDRGS